jgi:nitroimidazol reductase NimA-like FMN-containing flavoprotein (pyridoxamine 5'-phosphate oxidase superfamily)
MEELSRWECLALLAHHSVGRIGVSIAALPSVVPVNYTFDGERVLLGTGHGTKLAAALRDAVVCFEIDEVDAERECGWSVLVTGVARQLTGDAEVEARALLRPSWAGPAADHVMAIDTELVTGRRLTP